MHESDRRQGVLTKGAATILFAVRWQICDIFINYQSRQFYKYLPEFKKLNIFLSTKWSRDERLLAVHPELVNPVKVNCHHEEKVSKIYTKDSSYYSTQSMEKYAYVYMLQHLNFWRVSSRYQPLLPKSLEMKSDWGRSGWITLFLTDVFFS